VALLDRGWGKSQQVYETEDTHRYVIEAPAQVTREQWIQEYSTPMIEGRPAVLDPSGQASPAERQPCRTAGAA
jgi:hypothetical protein